MVFVMSFYSRCRQYLLFLILVLSITACGGSSESADGGGNINSPEQPDIEEPIVKDTQAPNLSGVSNQKINALTDFLPLEGISAVDDVDGDVTSSIIVIGNVDINSVGEYQLTYSASDSSGNKAEAQRIITVVNNAPAVNIDGKTTLSILDNVQLSLSVEDKENHSITWFVDDLPSGLVFDKDALTIIGQLTWQHINESLSFNVSATDGIDYADKTIQLTLNEVSLTNAEAFRFLTQATFGATDESMAQIKSAGIQSWVDQQVTQSSPYVALTEDQTLVAQSGTNLGILKRIMSEWAPDDSNYSTDSQTFNQSGSYYQILIAQSAATQELFLTSNEQLRHRMAYALSQILVASEVESPLGRRAEALSYYYDILAKYAFANYGDLLKAVAKSPAMGVYLSSNGNQRTQPDENNRPDENFAREIMQLFSIGLVELNIDGSPRLDENGKVIATYDQSDIQELARSLTGWSVNNDTRFGSVANSRGDFMKPMVDWDSEKPDANGTRYHDNESKSYLGTQVASGLTATQELDLLIETLMAHNNIAPFVSKKLIQHFVTSNPSSAYIARVASAFNDNGKGQKGDLAAVIKAVLLDNDARDPSVYMQANFGKLRESFLQYTQLQRAYNAYPAKGWRNKNDDPVMSGVYTDLRVEKDFKQAPLRSSSVFNFYSPTYAPIDKDFKDNGLVLPELEISTGQDLVKATNRLRTTIQNSTFTQADVLAEHPTRSIINKLIIINFAPQMEIFKKELGDGYELFKDDTVNADGRTPLQQAIWLYLIDTDERLMGYSMSAEYYELMFNYLDNLSYGNAETRIKRTILYSMHLFISTNHFKVLK